MDALIQYWPILIAVALGAVGYGELKSTVNNLRKDIDTGLRRDVDAKANKELVEANYREIIRRLDLIERRLERRNTAREEE